MYDCGRPTCQDEAVIDHFGINCSDWDKSKAFYDKVLGVLGYSRQMDYQVAIGYGRDGKPDFWIADMSAGDAAGPNREIHVAFQAADADAVTAFYNAAVEAGAESLHAPRLWPEYHPGYFGAFVRDPDGNNVEAVFHGAAPQGQAIYQSSSAMAIMADPTRSPRARRIGRGHTKGIPLRRVISKVWLTLMRRRPANC
jgi:catechol 2,3-dioxygenase-like lactoylglutathione lyase family enzyme